MNFFVKILAVLFFNSLFFCALNAQEVAVQQPNIRIVDGQVQVEVSLTASQLDLGSTGRFRLEFSIDGPQQKLLLPEVVYTGTQRGRFDGRNAFLSGGIQVPAYHIEYDVKVGRSYALDYRISIPYQSWMEHASVSFRGYLLVCGEEINTMNRLLAADLNPLRQLTVPNVWAPDRAVYSRMVCFLVPQSEEVKKRADKVEVNIDYPVNDAQVRPAYGRNAEELQKVKELMDDILGHALITVDRLSVTGYASPEGSYRANEQLARRRAEGFTQYLQNNYRLLNLSVDTRWVAEDWDGFIAAVRTADLPQKNDILRVANNRNADPDSRERMLNQLALRGSELHRQINTQIYPPYAASGSM